MTAADNPDPERMRRFEEQMRELRPGEIRHGVICHIANFGAFVDLGDVIGLVHISQIGWGRINHPGEALQIGQEVTVQVLSVDIERRKIALSMKHATSDPWIAIQQRYAIGQIVMGVVTKISAYGAFISIDNGVEGLLYLAHAGEDQNLTRALREQEVLPWRIARIDMQRRRLILEII